MSAICIFGYDLYLILNIVDITINKNQSNSKQDGQLWIFQYWTANHSKSTCTSTQK